MTTKEKLILSALKLFSKKWFENTSTTSICTDAGFSSGALFVHFKTKNDLLDFIYLDIKQQYFDLIDKSEIETSGNFFTISAQHLYLWVQFYVKNPLKFRFIKRFINSPHLSKAIQKKIDAEMKPLFDALEYEKKQWNIKDIDTKLLISLITWAFYEMIDYSITHNKTITSQEVSAILDMLKK